MLIKTSKMVQNTKALGAIGTFKIDPEVYLNLTSNKSRQKIEQEALEIEDYNAFIQVGAITTLPFIKILLNGKVVGHEGRHRAHAVESVGGQYIEVALIIMTKDPKATDNTPRKLRYIPYKGKFTLADVPGVWTAQFSSQKYPVRLMNFRKF